MSDPFLGLFLVVILNVILWTIYGVESRSKDRFDYLSEQLRQLNNKLDEYDDEYDSNDD